MCGIFGFYNFDQTKAEQGKLELMSQALRHRGPDSHGMFIKDNIALGALRLSVIDLSDKANQPMFSRDSRYCIVYNGEVYNYAEIRKALSLKYQFVSHSDTEVVLNSFIEWGEICLDKFNGMFAFAILDTQEHRLFLARDRFGIKPLYYFLDDKKFIFSSEIKAFKNIPIQFSINDDAMYNYLVFNRTDYDENTFISRIKRLPHGHKISVKGDNAQVSRWYDLKNNLKQPYAAPVELRAGLRDSVSLQLRSDVPLGVCLSGGLDSSSITSVLLDDLDFQRLQTFSAVFGSGKTGDESFFIDRFKDRIGDGMYKTVVDAETVFNDLWDFIYYIDEPVPTPAPMIHYEVMKLAQGKAVVLLDGQGGDEQFAGYHYFFGFYFKELLMAAKFSLVKELMYYLIKHKSMFGIKSFLYFLLPAHARSGIKAAFLGSISKDYFRSHKGDDFIPEKLYSSNSLHDALLDHFEYKLEHLLKWEDRNSMRFSLESRVPFLDHRIVERSLSLSTGNLIKNGSTKWILREALKNVLPEEIYRRQDKIGFDNPCVQWFRQEKFKVFILDIINSQVFRSLPYFNIDQCNKIYQEHLNGNLDASGQIWKWINVFIWREIYLK
jgi:asparagine synthase (glutamine-hydrolysing)